MFKYSQQLFLFVVALIFYTLFNNLIPITDPVESNYALTAKEMLLADDWLSPRIYGQAWFDKPVMSYWLVMICYKFFGITEFASRLPAAFFGSLSVVLCYQASLIMFNNKKTALYAALILMSSLEFWLLNHLVLTDSVLFFFFNSAILFFYQAYASNNGKYLWWAFALCGGAVLTKGPIGLLLPGLILTVFSIWKNWWLWLYPRHLFMSLCAFSLVCVPWYWGMYSVHGSNFVETFLGLHNYVRATVSEHPQDNVWYYYLVLVPLSLFPWTFLFIYAIIQENWQKFLQRDKIAPNILFLWLWIILIVLFYSLMATKYLTYAFPVLLPASILVARALQTLIKRSSSLIFILPQIILLTVLLVMSNLKAYSNFSNVLQLYLGISIGALILFQLKASLEKIFYSTVFVVIICTLSMIYYVAVPIAYQRSGKNIAIDYIEKLPANTLIASIGDYSTAAVYYSGKTIYALRDTLEPNTSQWAGKYTMPPMLISEFLSSSQTKFIIVKNKSREGFLANPLYKDFVLIGMHDEYELYGTR